MLRTGTDGSKKRQSITQNYTLILIVIDFIPSIILKIGLALSLSLSLSLSRAVSRVHTLYSLIRAALGTLLAQDMEGGSRFGVAIATKHRHFQVSIFRGHRREFDLVIESLPNGRHVDHGDAAGGTGVVARLEQLLHTLEMQHVAALGHPTSFPTRVQVLQADGAVGTRHLLDAFVIVPHVVGWGGKRKNFYKEGGSGRNRENVQQKSIYL